MPRPRNKIPTYRFHKPSGKAYVKHDGRMIYLGDFDTPDSRRQYSELVASIERSATSQRITRAGSSEVSATVNELCLKFMTEEAPRYKTTLGKPSAEVDCYKGAIRILRSLFGETKAADFGPLRLRAVRSAMVEAGWSRQYIAKQISRIRHVFRFGVSLEMVPASVLDALKSLPPLRPGDSGAPESQHRKPVPLDVVETVKPHMKQRTRDLVDLLLLTGARPAELLSIRTCDVDRSGAVWKAALQNHKSAWRGLARLLFFGPKAKLILARYLKPAEPEARLFPIRRESLRQGIAAACERANVETFCTYQLRHACATLIRDELGIEAAQAIMGHKHVDMTSHYSALSERKAIETAQKLG